MNQYMVNFEQRTLSAFLIVTLCIVLHVLYLLSDAPIFLSANAQTNESVRVIDANSGDQFEIEGSLSNGIITNATLYPEHNYIVFDLVTRETEEGEMTLSLPRSLIDAKSEDLQSDDAFTVVLDNYETGYVETSSDESQRTIVVLIAPGVVEATIVGTQVLPEFSTIILALVGGVIACIIGFGRLSANSARLSR